MMDFVVVVFVAPIVLERRALVEVELECLLGAELPDRSMLKIR